MASSTVEQFYKLEELRKENDLFTKSLGRNGNIKRPMNAFMIWSRIYRKNCLKEDPKKTITEVSKILSSKWKSLPPSEKQIYVDEANRLKALHMKIYPDYKFNPKRRNKIDNKPFLIHEPRNTPTSTPVVGKLPNYPVYAQPHMVNKETNFPSLNVNNDFNIMLQCYQSLQASFPQFPPTMIWYMAMSFMNRNMYEKKPHSVPEK